MKSLISPCLLIGLLLTGCQEPQEASNQLEGLTFEDKGLTACVKRNVDEQNLKYIDDVIKLDCTALPNSLEESIRSLAGIGLFSHLNHLILKNNALENIELSELQNLETLYLSGNPLIQVDLSHNPVLAEIYIAVDSIEHPIAPLDLRLPMMTTYLNSISIIFPASHPGSLDLQRYVNLKDLKVHNIDRVVVNSNTSLKNITLTGPLSTLDLAGLNQLKTLELQAPNLTELNLSAQPQLDTVSIHAPIKSLDFSANEFLHSITLAKTNIEQLDLTANQQLVKVDLRQNPLAESRLKLPANGVTDVMNPGCSMPNIPGCP